MNAAWRKCRLHTAVQRVWKTGIGNNDISLALAVDTQRLFVNLRSEPVVENPCAATESDSSTLQRRPDKAQTRSEIKLAGNVILNLVTNAITDRQVLTKFIVVLNVPAKLILAVIDGRITDALRELSRQSCFERFEVCELESSKRVGPFVTTVTASFEQDAETNSVFLECVVDVVCNFEVEETATTTSLRAAVVECTRNEDCSTEAHRARFGFCPASLKAELVEEFLSKHSGITEARDVLSLILREPTSRKIEITDTEIVLCACIALKLQSRRVCFCQYVLRARVDIQSSRRTKR